MTRLHWVVRGRVQGVGYRWFVRETAQRLGVSGWVRNRDDGSVEGEAQADASKLEEFAALLKKGHPFARVDSVEERPVAGREEGGGFEIR